MFIWCDTCNSGVVIGMGYRKGQLAQSLNAGYAKNLEQDMIDGVLGHLSSDDPVTETTARVAVVIVAGIPTYVIAVAHPSGTLVGIDSDSTARPFGSISDNDINSEWGAALATMSHDQVIFQDTAARSFISGTGDEATFVVVLRGHPKQFIGY